MADFDAGLIGRYAIERVDKNGVCVLDTATGRVWALSKGDRDSYCLIPIKYDRGGFHHHTPPDND